MIGCLFEGGGGGGSRGGEGGRYTNSLASWLFIDWRCQIVGFLVSLKWPTFNYFHT